MRLFLLQMNRQRMQLTPKRKEMDCRLANWSYIGTPNEYLLSHITTHGFGMLKNQQCCAVQTVSGVASRPKTGEKFDTPSADASVSREVCRGVSISIFTTALGTAGRYMCARGTVNVRLLFQFLVAKMATIWIAKKQ